MASAVTADGRTINLDALHRAVAQEKARVDNILTTTRKSIEEHKALIKRLDELPRKLRHDVMVPFGTVGFMPGKIVRTNEVLMLVGDQYFVERSCYDANLCLKKRLTGLIKVVDDCEKEIKLLRDEISYADELFAGPSAAKDEVEINEPFDEAVEAEFQRKRQERRSQQATAASAASKEGEEDMMERLNRLELEEAEKGELDDEELSLFKRMQPPPGVSKEDFNRLIARLDDEDSSDLDEDEEEDESNSDEEGDYEPSPAGRPAVPPKREIDSDDLTDDEEEQEAPPVWEKIKENKKKQAAKSKGVRFAEKIEKVAELRKDEPVTSIQSAPDLHSKHTSSILRNRDVQTPVDHEALAAIRTSEEPRQKQVLPGSQTAFTGQVVEREIKDYCTSEPSTSAGQKPVSKFKRQRAGK